MKYYLAGIKGKKMTILACLLSDLGYDVVGYEDEEYSSEILNSKGIVVYNNILDLNEDCIVVYDDLEEGHRVFLKSKELNLKVYNYSDMIEKLVRKFDTICVSGCHGKTTVSNMLKIAIDSNYIIDNNSMGNKESNYFIYEEENINNDYEPEYIIITSMEPNNMDNYQGIDDMINQYQEYANKSSKMVIACGDDPYTHTLNVNKQIFYYGVNEDNDITARDIEYLESGTNFDVYVEDEYYGHFELPIYGKYMLLNVLASIAICHYERMDAKEISKKLKEFNYLNEEISDNIIIKSNAKSNIELKSLIKGIKQKYPEKNICVVNSAFEKIEDVIYINNSEINKYKDYVIINLEG